MTSTITILGSTGSVGISTLRVLRSLRQEYSVYGLSCYGNLNILETQISEFHPKAVAIGSLDVFESDHFHELKKRFPDIEFFGGEDGIIELSARDVSVLVSAIVGAAGLAPSYRALSHVKRIALANKETLVIAGDMFMEKVEECGVELIPLDSEHSAVFTLLEKIRPKDVKRIILTASGGSLRDRPIDALCSVTPEEALAHPTWKMGNKITIDSSTLMNKGFEVIEAHHLFNMEYDCIDVVIHPESIVHSMVETVDSAVYAYMGVADMALPIVNALTFPEKRENSFGRLDFTKNRSLNFYPCDNKRYPALELCYNAGISGGTMPAVLNAANEVAVSAFLDRKIAFTDITKIIEKTLDAHSVAYMPNLEEITDADKWARVKANEMIRG